MDKVKIAASEKDKLMAAVRFAVKEGGFNDLKLQAVL
jgi:hypothetical protein